MDGMLYYLFGILLFVAVVLFVEGAYLWWNDSRGPEVRRIESRLRLMSAGARSGDNVSIVKERLLAESPGLQRALLQVPRIHSLDRLLAQSGLSWSVAQFIALTIVAAAAAALVATLLGRGRGLVLLAAIIGAVLPLVYVFNARTKRLAKLDEQLPDALDLMSRALRAGHAFPSALQMVGDELPEPVAAEFRVAFDEINYGIAVKDALANLATRVPLDDLRYFVIAVLIQRDTGGNLAELLDKLASLIRARHRLHGQIRVLSAEGRLSATILCILPFVVGTILYLINPSFIEPLWRDPLGIRMLVVGSIAMAIGVIWSIRIVNIRV